MADNYIEKRMEEYRSGRTVIRRANPSMDSLLRQIGDQAETDKDYLVKQAQLDAALRSAAMIPECGELRFETDEARAEIHILGHSSPQSSLMNAGQAVLAIRMKAAELGLKTLLEYPREANVAANQLLCRVKLYK